MAEYENLKDRDERLSLSPRLAEIDRVLVAIEADLDDSDPGNFTALSALLVDATLDGDESALDLAFSQLQRLLAIVRKHSSRRNSRLEGRLLSLIEVTQSGMQRSLPLDLMAQFVEPDSQAHEFLKLVAGGPGQSNLGLAAELGVSETAASRIGRRLIQSGLARKRKVGRTNQWVITPRGIHVLSVLDAGGVLRPTREHRQLAH